ncbi:MAG: indolepyruvate oxidoreductase subunit beta [Bacteroidota bacterium]|nr:indolepyruvate oxidoreductase subunit beta [Bacteroidota bacterium]
MKYSNIILAGVGGQGILTIATTIGMASLKEDLFFKQSEVHGMSQRGGAVQSHFRISDQPVHSDLIPKGQADLILSVEPLESLRYLPFLKSDGWLICNATPFINVPDYPVIEKVHAEIAKWPGHLIIEADKIARELGTVKASNMVVLGAASSKICLDFASLEHGIRQMFSRKGEDLVNLNIAALRAGRDFAG